YRQLRRRSGLAHIHTRRLVYSYPTRRSSDLIGLICHALGRIAPAVQLLHQAVARFAQFDIAERRSLGHQAIQVAFQIGKLGAQRSEEHTSELQSRENLVCRPVLAETMTSHET